MKKSISDLGDVRGKRALVRVDVNVPLDENKNECSKLWWTLLVSKWSKDPSTKVGKVIVDLIYLKLRK